ncbi:hypothetical protein BC826DRAFT_674603 [Russula brevipes]|nr:hypothetical protein BC826DRAFT_674603 [Russula brevipes]
MSENVDPGQYCISGIAKSLLSSASHLVTLWLGRIPPVSGYISPAALATCLAALPNLEELHIDFRSSVIRQSRTVPSSPPYVVLPAVTSFCFKGDGGYLEDLVGQIDTPMVQTISITLHGGSYHLPQLYPFVCRAGRLEASDHVAVEFDVLGIYLKFKPSDNFQLAVTCYGLARQVSSMAQLCHELSPLLTGVERLDLHGKRLASQPAWEHVVDPPWSELFQLFIAVKRLFVSKKLGPIVATALRGFTGERSTEVFPELRSLFLEEHQPSGRVQEATSPFVASRKVFDRPVDVFCWVRELGKSSDFGVQWVDE